MNSATIALLRRGWRAEDWTAPMRGLDSEGRQFTLMLGHASGGAMVLDARAIERLLPVSRGFMALALLDLDDPATFALALRVLGGRVGIEVPDGDPRPLVWSRRNGVWWLEAPGSRLPGVWWADAPVATEPDPVTALAMALCETNQQRETTCV